MIPLFLFFALFLNVFLLKTFSAASYSILSNNNNYLPKQFFLSFYWAVKEFFVSFLSLSLSILLQLVKGYKIFRDNNSFNLTSTLSPKRSGTFLVLDSGNWILTNCPVLNFCKWIWTNSPVLDSGNWILPHFRRWRIVLQFESVQHWNQFKIISLFIRSIFF